MPSHLSSITRRIQHLVHAGHLRSINRAICLPSCGSTQDEAITLASSQPGLLVTTEHQHSGRGRLGRAWADTQGHGLAATFVLDARAHQPELVSLACGIAACIACERACHRASIRPRPAVGLKWPNDVVESAPGARPGRKLAGVLVERRDDLLLAGIGINITQAPADFPTDLATRAASLSMIGARANRLATLLDLTLILDRTLARSRDEILAAWRQRDIVTGREATFEHNGQRYDGRVLSIQPLGEIEVRTSVAQFARLPALQTTMVPGTLR